MTTPDDPRGPVPDADPLDEIAAAIVDGEATDEERARVASDPVLAARVAAFEAVARLVATPVPPLPDDRREAAIAAALAAPPAAGTNVVPMRRAPVWQRAWLPAAAAVAVVVGGLGLLVATLGSAGNDTDQDTAAEAPTEATAFAERDDAGGVASGPPTTAAQQLPGAGAAGGAAADSAVETSAAPADLGDLPDVASLEALLREDTSANEEAATFAPAPCSERFGSFLERVLTARVGGTPVSVAVYATPDGARSYEMYDQATCEPLAAGTL